MNALHRQTTRQILPAVFGLGAQIIIGCFVPAVASDSIVVARQTESISDDNQRAPAANGSRNCPAEYHTSLEQLDATAAANLQRAANKARSGDYRLPGHWLFWRPERAISARRRAARAASDVIVIEDRMCVRSVIGRGGANTLPEVGCETGELQAVTAPNSGQREPAAARTGSGW